MTDEYGRIIWADPTYPPASGTTPVSAYGPLINSNGDLVVDAAGNQIMVQDIFDSFGYLENDDGSFTVSEDPDGILEIKMNPEAPGQAGITAGNSGTIDFGASNNSASDIARQIRYGLDDVDLSYYEGNEIVIAPESPFEVMGVTGISGGPIESAMNDILGKPRAIALFDSVSGTGSNAIFTLVEIVGARVLSADLSGSDKYVYIQPAAFIDGAARPNLETPPGDNATVFSPLIVIE